MIFALPRGVIRVRFGLGRYFATAYDGRTLECIGQRKDCL